MLLILLRWSCIACLLGALQAEAAHNDTARQALEHIVLGETA